METKIITIPCKLCAKEFTTELALDVYPAVREHYDAWCDRRLGGDPEAKDAGQRLWSEEEL